MKTNSFMETIHFETSIAVKYETDVLVIGGGPAGFCAALAAGRLGVRTLLVEKEGCAGGMATMGLVNPFMTCYNKSAGAMIIRGLFEEIVNRLVERGGAVHPSEVKAPSAFTSWITKGHAHVTPFDAEIFKVLADEMLDESGVMVLYHTAFVKALKEDTRVTGAIIHSKKGLEGIKAKIIIDCTGDGDAAADAGAAFELGDEKNKLIQPASLFFRIGNVDSEKLEADIEKNKANFYRREGINYRSFHWHVTRARNAGDWKLGRVSVGLFRGVAEDEWSVNTSRIMGVDGTDNESLTKAETEGRRQAAEIFAFIKKYLPGCEKAALLSTAATVGIRESRHIRGDYLLTAEDLLQGRAPDDSILLAANAIDIHGRFGPLSNEYAEVEEGEYYGISYRCLLPHGVENILTAGRCISATSEAAGAIRVMPVCMGTGQAAGTAAALAVRKGRSPADLDTGELRELLKEQGAYFGA
jgi:hypothetical protein